MTNHGPWKTRNLAACGLVFAATLLGVPGSALGQPGPGSPNAADEKRAMTLAAEAKAALAAGKTQDALRGFRDAWAVARTAAIAANLATIEASFGLHRDAVEHFEFALQHLPQNATNAQKRAVAAAFEAEVAQVTTVRIRSVPAVISISIDGVPVAGDMPADKVYLEPGRHEVRAEAPGYQAATRTIDEIAGSTVPIEFNLDAINVAAAPATPPELIPAAVQIEPLPPESSERRSRVPLFIGGGLVLASAAVGTVLLVQSNHSFDDAAARHDALPPGNSCGNGTPFVEQCQALKDAYDTAYRERNFAIGAFVVGGIAAIGTATYWLWPRARPRGAPVADASVAPGYALVRARWSW
jgi:hypothetical protein